MDLDSTDIRIRLVLEFMRRNVERRLACSELAAHVSLSESRFRHLFTAQTGMSPQHVLSELRFAQAAQLLAETQLTIEQVALSVGWQDRSHFDRRFKETYGLTPAQYRISHRSTRSDKFFATANLAIN